MIRNPELRRQLWLELSPHRLVLLPVLLALLLVGVGFAAEGDAPVALATTSSLAFGVIVLAWGFQLASAGMTREIEGHTWDTQRMTPLSPWTMTWGKLLGCPAYAWYGGVLAIAAYLVIPHLPLHQRLAHALLFVLLGIWFHAMSLLGTLHAIQKHPEGFRTPGLVIVGALGVLFALPFFSQLLGLAERQVEVTWYGVEFALLPFALVSVATFGAWAVAGVYRLMRRELALRGGPWVWMAFVPWLMLYTAGLIDTLDVSARLLSSYLLGIALVYALLFTEAKDFSALRRIASRAARGEWRRAFEVLPCWAATLPIVVGAGLLLLLAPRAGAGYANPVFVLQLLLFPLRDIGLVVGLNLGGNAKRADLAALVYLVVLYGLLPMTAIALDAQPVAQLCLPRPDGTLWNALLPAAIWATASLAWARWRWRRADRILQPI